MADDCPFCRISAGTEPAHIVHQTPHAVAFLDENPATDGHVLVIPRDHVTGLEQLERSGFGAVFEAIHTVSAAIDRSFDADGLSFFYSTGSLVGTIDHAHVHLIPRFEHDTISVSLTRSALEPDNGRQIADRIRTAI